MFKNLFGKKNDGFFMQVDESKPAAAVETPTEVVAASETSKTAAKFKNPFAKKSPATLTPVDEAKPAAAPMQTTAVETPTEIVAAPESTKATKTSVKDKKKKKEKEAKATEPATTVTATAPVASATQSLTNFATDYLIQPSSNSSRRRPGANMKSFVTMAREVKVGKLSKGATIAASAPAESPKS